MTRDAEAEVPVADDARAGGRMSGRRSRRAVLCAASVLLCAAPLAACSAEETPEVPIGRPLQPYDAGGAEVETTRRVWIPGGRLQVGLEAAALATVDGRRTAAPEGARFVRVRWTPSQQKAPPVSWPGAASSAKGLPPTRLVLETGGRRYAVASIQAWNVPADLVFALPGLEGDPLPTVVLESAGRRMRAVSGAELPRPSEPQRRARAVADATIRLKDHLVVHRSPYVAGLGWAPRGQVWVAVDETEVAWDGSATTKAGDMVDIGAHRLSVTVVSADGARPARTAGRDVAGTALATTATRAWLVPQGRTARLTMRVRGGGARLDGDGRIAVGADEDVVVPPSEGG